MTAFSPIASPISPIAYPIVSPIATGLPVEHVEIAWPVLQRLIRPAIDRSTDAKLDEILPMLRRLEAQAWLVYDGPVAVAGIVSRLLREGTSGHLDCRIWLVGGSRMSEWLPDFFPKLYAFAVSEGCGSISGGGRHGWLRLARQFGAQRTSDEDGRPVWQVPL